MTHQAIQKEMSYSGPEAREPVLDAHRRERGKRLRSSILSALLTKPLAVVIPVVSVPVFLRKLGLERFGLYETTSALGGWLALTNLGTSLGLVNQLTDCYVDGKRSEARRSVSTFLAAQLAVSVVLVVLATLASLVLPWDRIFAASDSESVRQIPMAVWVGAFTVAAGLLVNLSGSVYTAYQELDRNNLWDGLAKICTLGAVVAASFVPLNVAGAVAVMAGTPMVIRLLNLAFLFKVEKPWLRPRRGDFDPKLLRRLFRDGIGFLILQMAIVGIYQTDKLIIALRLRLLDVTPYAVLHRCFFVAHGLFMLVLVPLWPAHGEALRRGDTAWTERSLRASLTLGVLLMGGFGLIFLIAGESVVQFWTRQPVEFSAGIAVALTLMYVIRVWTDSHSIVLNAAGVIRPQSWLFIGHALLNLVISWLAAPRFGVQGVAWATVVSGLVTNAWGQPWLMHRTILKRKRPSPTNS